MTQTWQMFKNRKNKNGERMMIMKRKQQYEMGQNNLRINIPFMHSTLTDPTAFITSAAIS